ncbi:hypothetical protein C8046_11510 [Serinibacter arcticus]|uniref:Uncharacterized protein n=1 Tax=Serinibacter arcticus TaxID=1655435 RepID=A0A2U1ZW83_9MICO|nr:hypothetical protein [Serinibacter arcticus]PWD51182.1 hypothetical protein C8046_11510 [Serinibacter arcticus]
MTTPPSDPSAMKHWTELPGLADTATRLLRIDRETAARHSAILPGAVHVWTPGRGGPQLLMDFAGNAMVADSALSQELMLTAFNRGMRTDDAEAARLIHAGSNLMAYAAATTGRTPTKVPREDPGADAIGALGRGPFQQTTPEEIEARLSRGGVGSWVFVGIDRAHGPGHWFMAAVTAEGIQAVDPLIGRNFAWPPEIGAIRWWTDGPPSTPPARVVVDVRSPRGVRIWTETRPELQGRALEILEYFARSEDLHARSAVWNSFSWAAVASSGSDLRLATTDLTKPGIKALTWDVDPMLELREAEMRVAAGVRRDPIHLVDHLRWRPEIVERGRAVLRRRSRADGDTGWLLTTSVDDDGADLPLVAAHEVHRVAPWVTPFLSHPVGTLLEVAADGTVTPLSAPAPATAPRPRPAASPTTSTPAPPSRTGPRAPSSSSRRRTGSRARSRATSTCSGSCRRMPSP